MSEDAPFQLDREALAAVAKRYAGAYAAAEPFPHVVLDGFFPERVLDEVLEEFPAGREDAWTSFDRGYEKKLASVGDADLGARTRHLIAELNSAAFVSFLERLTGIDGLIPDPHLEGGGLHKIERGGYLKIHVDFNRHPKLKLDRRINVLVFLNKDWKPEYGGELELWTRDMRRCEVRLPPVFNRMVIFNTTEYSYHGHPDPLACPEGSSRKSLALYYYSNGRPARELAPGHRTLFRFRPGERVRLSYDVVLTKLMPPLLLDAARWLRDRRAR